MHNTNNIIHITISYVTDHKRKKLECYLTVHNIAAVIKRFSFSSTESSVLNVCSHINSTVYVAENILRFFILTIYCLEVLLAPVSRNVLFNVRLMALFTM